MKVFAFHSYIVRLLLIYHNTFLLTGSNEEGSHFCICFQFPKDCGGCLVNVKEVGTMDRGRRTDGFVTFYLVIKAQQCFKAKCQQ